jgi:hypothetical protein
MSEALIKGIFLPIGAVLKYAYDDVRSLISCANSIDDTYICKLELITAGESIRHLQHHKKQACPPSHKDSAAHETSMRRC